ncbi:pancreatic triacylglycerol lipase-like [Tachypleus tridentatus]|uniref:pancreatic triacylglycerol lipase-like n=1 Tax=Tachypleus tridentatus TaxID=6853 RepID=UPI003FD0594E
MTARLCLLVITTLTSVGVSYSWSYSNVNEESPNDFKIWNAIVTSLTRWRELRKRKITHHSHVHKRDEEVVCYTQYNWCFRDEGPFDYLDTLPESPQAIGTQFYLFTRKNPHHGDLLHYNDKSSLYFSHFNGSNPVKIVIHGFGGSADKSWVKQMVEGLLYVGDMNVIVVDWEKGAKLPNYVQAAANTQLIGKEIAQLIRLINYERGTTNHDFHLIGFSLGAHVAGFVGMEIKNLSRITGLDPAAPLFEGYEAKVRLDPTDAKFVDVIHSNGDSMIRGGFGAYESMGHVDFFPNGGKFQQGCSGVFIGALSDILWGQWKSLCHHRRALRFFMNSLMPSCSFPSVACDSYEDFVRGDCFTCFEDACGNMGYYADKSARQGRMYLLTRAAEPFCGNQYKVMVNSTEGQGKTWGVLEITLVGEKGVNERFSLTKDSHEIQDSESIRGIVVTHPLLTNISRISLLYTKYKGWIYSGLDEWKVDKVSITDSFGNIFSYCNYATVLRNGERIKLDLETGECVIPPPFQRAPRLVWEIVREPIKGPSPLPPKVLWTLSFKR